MVEANRNNLFLLDQSLPQIPQVNKVIDDLNKAASDSGVLIKKVDIGEVNLKVDKSSRDTKTFAVDIETESDFTQVRRFIDVFMSQRRLKTMTNLSIIKEVGGFGDSFGSSESAILKIKLEVDGHYL
jgi:Tfp pilus assembly protein PilO